MWTEKQQRAAKWIFVVFLFMFWNHCEEVMHAIQTVKRERSVSFTQAYSPCKSAGTRRSEFEMSLQSCVSTARCQQWASSITTADKKRFNSVQMSTWQSLLCTDDWNVQKYAQENSASQHSELISLLLTNGFQKGANIFHQMHVWQETLSFISAVFYLLTLMGLRFFL